MDKDKILSYMTTALYQELRDYEEAYRQAKELLSEVWCDGYNTKYGSPNPFVY